MVNNWLNFHGNLNVLTSFLNRIREMVSFILSSLILFTKHDAIDISRGYTGPFTHGK